MRREGVRLEVVAEVEPMAAMVASEQADGDWRVCRRSVFRHHDWHLRSGSVLDCVLWLLIR